MKILAIDSSSTAASVAVMEDDKLLVELVVNYQRTHSEKLIPMIEETLKHCGLKAKDVDVFAASIGPGSFTGLRIGVTTLKVMAQALNKPVVGISTLEALAFNLPYCDGILCPIIDAQREMVYSCLYEWRGDQLEALQEPVVISINELLEELKVQGKRVVFLGDAVDKFKQDITAVLKEQATFPPSAWTIVRAASIGALALKRIEEGQLIAPEELLPIYMRKSQAENQYEERMKGRESS